MSRSSSGYLLRLALIASLGGFLFGYDTAVISGTIGFVKDKFGLVVSLLVIGALFQAGATEGPWLLIFILIYIACFAASFGPVIWVLLAEMYPTRVRGRAMSVATFALWGGTALVGQTVPWLLETLQPSGTFWLFAVLCAPAIYLGWKVLPETKGKSLEEIEAYWMSRG